MAEELVTFRGLQNLDETLRILPGELERGAVRLGLRRAGEYLRQGAVSRAPRLTGQLANSIEVSVRTDRTYGLKVVVGPNKRGFYGHFLEFGTKFLTPRRWLSASLAADFQQAVSVFAVEVREHAERTIRRLARDADRQARLG